MQNQSCFGGRLIVAPLVHLLLIPSTPMHLKLINNPLCYLTDHIIIREVQLKSCHTLIKKCSFNFFEQCSSEGEFFFFLLSVSSDGHRVQLSRKPAGHLLCAGGLGGGGGDTQVSLNSECSSVGHLPQLQCWISWNLAHLYSHFHVSKEQPVLRHNYYSESNSCPLAAASHGFNCRAKNIFIMFLDSLMQGPTFGKPPRIVKIRQS